MALAVLAGCQSSSDNAPPAEKTAPATQGQAAGLSGKVVETMDSGGYTYVRLDTGSKEIWAAGPVSPIKVGDEISVPTGMEMRGFQSNTLNRTFDSIYFVSTFGKGDDAHAEGAPSMPPGHPDVSKSTSSVDLSSIAKAEGGLTVSEIWAKRADLAGTDVVVRGRVVKFTAGVMGRNWVHIRDGSGTEGANDLTITTDQSVKVGDLVLVSGRAAVDKDFGAGYKYGILLEEASVQIEEGVGADS